MDLIFGAYVLALYAVLGAAPMVLVFFKKLEFRFFVVICFTLLTLPWVYVYHSETDSIGQGYIILIASVHILTSIAHLFFMGFYICCIRQDVQSRTQMCRLWLWSEFYSFLFPAFLITCLKLPEMLRKLYEAISSYF